MTLAKQLSKVVTRKPPAGQWNRIASRAFGGVTLYCKDAETLDNVVAALCEAVANESKLHLLLIRQVLRSSTSKSVGVSIDDRLFGAIVGRLLRVGTLRVLPALSVNGKLMRILYHQDNEEYLQSIVDRLELMLSDRGSLQIKEAYESVVGRDVWGGWFMSQQLLGNLAYKGRAIQFDDAQFFGTGEVQNAVDDIGT